MTLAKAKVVTYDCNSSFIVLAIVITIVNYDRKTFIVQATGKKFFNNGSRKDWKPYVTITEKSNIRHLGMSATKLTLEWTKVI